MQFLCAHLPKYICPKQTFSFSGETQTELTFLSQYKQIFRNPKLKKSHLDQKNVATSPAIPERRMGNVEAKLHAFPGRRRYPWLAGRLSPAVQEAGWVPGTCPCWESNFGVLINSVISNGLHEDVFVPLEDTNLHFQNEGRANFVSEERNGTLPASKIL